jgi:hypothetical protein
LAVIFTVLLTSGTGVLIGAVGEMAVVAVVVSLAVMVTVGEGSAVAVTSVVGEGVGEEVGDEVGEVVGVAVGVAVRVGVASATCSGAVTTTVADGATPITREKGRLMASPSEICNVTDDGAVVVRVWVKANWKEKLKVTGVVGGKSPASGDDWSRKRARVSGTC